jgi:hypothetical protein
VVDVFGSQKAIRLVAMLVAQNHRPLGPNGRFDHAGATIRSIAKADVI